MSFSGDFGRADNKPIDTETEFLTQFAKLFRQLVYLGRYVCNIIDS